MEKVHDGDKIDFDTKEFDILKFVCCDCGLTHDMRIKIKNKHKIIITQERNIEDTRKHRKEEFGYLHEGLDGWKLRRNE